MASDSPAIAQMKLSQRLRELRIAAGFTIEEAAAELLCSMATVSRAETGDRRADGRTVRSMCVVYGAGEAVMAELVAAALRARVRDPWVTEPVNSRGALYLSLEQSAATLTCFARDAMPALLRTAGYDQALGRPYPGLREARQMLLDRIPARFLLDEAVLRRHPGAEIMAGQLGHILHLAEAGATVQVVPFRASLISCREANFTILDFAGELAPMVFSETPDKYQDHTGELEYFQSQADWLQGVALDPAESVKMIAEMRNSLGG